MNTEEQMFKYTLGLYGLTCVGSELFDENNKPYGFLKNYGFNSEGVFCLVVRRYSSISALPIKITLEG